MTIFQSLSVFLSNHFRIVGVRGLSSLLVLCINLRLGVVLLVVLQVLLVLLLLLLNHAVFIHFVREAEVGVRVVGLASPLVLGHIKGGVILLQDD